MRSDTTLDLLLHLPLLVNSLHLPLGQTAGQTRCDEYGYIYLLDRKLRRYIYLSTLIYLLLHLPQCEAQVDGSPCYIYLLVDMAVSVLHLPRRPGDDVVVATFTS